MFTQKPLTRRRAVWSRVAIVAISALALAACFRAETNIEVNQDGSGTVGFLIAMDMETMEGLAGAFEDFEDFEGEDFEEEEDFEFDPAENPFLEDFEDAELPPGTTIEPYEEDGWMGVWVRVPFQSEGDVAQTLAELFEVVGEDDEMLGSDGFETFRLERQGDLWIFEAELAADEDSDFASDDPAEMAFLEAFFPDEPYVFSIKLPGGVVDHNADRVADDGTLIWVLDIFTTESRQINATSDITAAPGAVAPDTTEAAPDTTEAPEEAEETTPVDAPDEAAAPVEEEGGISPALIAAIVAAALAAGAGITLALRRRGVDTVGPVE